MSFLALLPLLACLSPAESGKDDPAVVHDVDTVVEDLSVTRADIATVLRVRWRTATPSRALVTGRFAGGDLVEVREQEETTEHEVLLAGFPAKADVTVQVRVEADASGDAVEATITTGSLPTWLPDVTVTRDVPEGAEGGFTVTSVIDFVGGGVVVYDGAGRPVWAYQSDEDPPRSIIRARRSLDGTAMLYNNMAAALDGPGFIVRVPMDGGPSTEFPIVGAHTDFVELPSGGYAVLGWEARTFGDRQLVGDTIVEVDEDGGTTVVWSAFDDFTPDLSRAYDHWFPSNPEAEDWTHINGLAYDAATDAYYVSMTWNDAVARIDRDSGRLAWWLSDAGGSFEKDGGGTLVHQPHSVQPTAEGLLLFNRGNPRDPTTCSGATDVALDEEKGTARVLSTYTSEKCLLVTFLGSAQRLAGGNTLVSWSMSGQLEEVTPDGEVALRLNTAIGAGFGFAERVEKLTR